MTDQRDDEPIGTEKDTAEWTTGAGVTSRLVAVAIDCRDPEVLVAFWCEALGYRVLNRWNDARGTRYTEIGTEDVVLLFQQVGDPKTVKNRLHLDIAPVHGSRDEEARRLVALGARVVDEAVGLPWVVLRDPEDNEFCVLPPRS